MSATEQLIAYHMSRLSDKNAQVRLKSIEELVLLGATEALSTLEQLFRTDPDEDVRKAAQRGGRELFLKTKKPEP